MGAPPNDPAGQAEVAAFVKALAELGWVEGRNIAFAYRWSGSDIALAEMFAKELIASNPDILVARSTPPTMALKSATSTIPIVFVNVTEPISSGIVPNLVRPRGNITGFVAFEASIGGKWMQLLKEVAEWAHHRQSGFPHQGPYIHASITKRPRENPFLLPKAIPQIRRMKVNLLMD